MANTIFNRGIYISIRGDIDLDAAGTVIRAGLVRDTSTYTPNKDHDFVSDFTSNGGVFVTAGGYAAQTLANKALNLDDTNDRVEWDFDDVAFGTVAAGQGAEAILIWRQTGGDDLSPTDDELIAFIDTAGGTPGLPITFNGTPVTMTVNAEGFIQMAQP